MNYIYRECRRCGKLITDDDDLCSPEEDIYYCRKCADYNKEQDRQIDIMMRQLNFNPVTYRKEFEKKEKLLALKNKKEELENEEEMKRKKLLSLEQQKRELIDKPKRHRRTKAEIEADKHRDL